MIELGQLEASHQEFAKRKARVVVVSDAGRQLAEAVQVIQRQSAPGGGDTTAPTTILVDGQGTVRWTFRADRFLTRLTPAEVLAAFDEPYSFP